MKFPHVIMVCCFSALCLDSSEVLEVSGHVGGEVSIRCSGRRTAHNSSEPSRMFFCKRTSCRENILIQIKRRRSAVTQQSRYNIEVDRRSGVFTVTIKNLERMDAGQYQCGVEKAINMLYQEVNLIVLEASTTVHPGSPPSTTTGLQTKSDALPWSNFLSSTEPSAAALSLPPAKKKRNLQQATDLTVVIIISGSLAVLVCAIIPLIFYGRWRSNSEGHNGSRGNKHEGDYCEGDADVGVRLQTFQPEVDPECSSDNASQYASIYAALDPKTLD